MATELRYNAATGETVEVTYSIPFASQRESKWAGAKARRDAEIDRGVTVPGLGTFDSDEISRSNINGAVTMALIAKSAAQPFAMGWKLQDNSVVQILDADTMIAVGVAVGNHVAACHGRAQQLGIAIQSAKDEAGLNTIDIAAGWPG